MEANELRFKNIVLFNGNIIEIGITQMCNFSFWEKHEQELHPTMWQPIPLTEEWLLKFGFEEKSKSKNFYLGNFRFHISKPANYDGFIFCDGYDVITDRIKYVHQLQNLYFALIGEELILKN